MNMQNKFLLGEFFCGPGGIGYGSSLARVTNKMGAGIAMKRIRYSFWLGCGLFQFRYGCVSSRYFLRYGSKAG